MGWWEREISFESMIDSALWYIEMKLKPWVKNLIDIALSGIEKATGVGETFWTDLELWLDARVEDFLPDVLKKIIGARNLAQYLHDTLKIDLEKKIKAVSLVPEKVVTLVMTKLEPKITSARQYADYLHDTLDIEVDKRIATVNKYVKTAQGEVLDALDKRIAAVMVAMSSMDTVAGKARVTFYNRLKAIIDEVEREAKDNVVQIYNLVEKHIKALDNAAKKARDVLDTKLSSAIRLVETTSKSARDAIFNRLDSAIKLLEREAKEAREVLEGSLIVIIENIEDALERALADLELTFDRLLKALTNRVGVLEGWVKNFATLFDTELNKYQSRVVTWIVDGFEGILDRVFK